MNWILQTALVFYALPLFIFGIYNMVKWKLIMNFTRPIPKHIRKFMIFFAGTVLIVTSTLICTRFLLTWGCLGLLAIMVSFIFTVHLPNCFLAPTQEGEYSLKHFRTHLKMPYTSTPTSIWIMPYNPLLYLFKDLNIAGAAIIIYLFADQIQKFF